MKNSREIGAYIRKARKEKNMTLAELAARVGVSSAALSRYELGQREITPEMIIKIADALEVNWMSLCPKDETASSTVASIFNLMEKFGRALVVSTSDEASPTNEKPEVKEEKTTNSLIDDSISYYYDKLSLYGKEAVADYLLQHIGETEKKAKRGLLEELNRLAAIPQYQRLDATDTND